MMLLPGLAWAVKGGAGQRDPESVNTSDDSIKDWRTNKGIR